MAANERHIVEWGYLVVWSLARVRLGLLLPPTPGPPKAGLKNAAIPQLGS